MYNLLLWVLVWYRLAGRINGPHFWEHVSPVVYGDDNVVGVDEEAKEFFNQDTVVPAFAEFGMQYVEETKTGKIVAPTRRIEECTFLKRAFRYDGELGRWVAPLELSTALYLPYWCHNRKLVEDITRENVETCLLELSLHAPNVWDTYVPQVLVACQDRLRYVPLRQPDRLVYADAALTAETWL
jgi:hypothetical protein